MLRKSRTTVYDFHFHIIFVTKYRKQIFTTKQLRDDMKAIMKKVARNNDVTIEHIEVMPDHLHLMISFKPKEAPSNVVKSLKGASARWWFKQYPETKKKLWGGHLWSPSFFIATCGNVSKDIVASYIESQMERRAQKENGLL